MAGTKIALLGPDAAAPGALGGQGCGLADQNWHPGTTRVNTTRASEAPLGTIGLLRSGGNDGVAM
ncbi:MAG: hypothetical protein DCC68_15300 [Planctomycetota bacterium]|nr:MAG: hypothetical protein DCC68_15300 [Planctomycetota bacterium]